MADRDAPAAELDELAAALRTSFPADTDAPLALALLRSLSDEPVTAATLAERVGQSSQEVAARLHTWPNLERDERGDVTGFAGLTLRATAHAFLVNGRRLHTWCAWDTLFLPVLLDASAEIRSTCAMSGAEVELVVDPRGVQRAPAELYVSFPPPATTDTANVTASFCCHVLFLLGADAASRWQADRPGDRVLDVRTAFHLGALTVGPLLAASVSNS